MVFRIIEVHSADPLVVGCHFEGDNLQLAQCGSHLQHLVRGGVSRGCGEGRGQSGGGVSQGVWVTT